MKAKPNDDLEAVAAQLPPKTLVRILLGQANDELGFAHEMGTQDDAHATAVRKRIETAIRKITKAQELVVTELRSK